MSWHRTTPSRPRHCLGEPLASAISLRRTRVAAGQCCEANLRGRRGWGPRSGGGQPGPPIAAGARPPPTAYRSDDENRWNPKTVQSSTASLSRRPGPSAGGDGWARLAAACTRSRPAACSGLRSRPTRWRQPSRLSDAARGVSQTRSSRRLRSVAESPYREMAPRLDTYAVAWDRLRRLRRREAYSVVAIGVLVPTCALLVPPLAPFVFGALAIVLFATSIAVTRFRCPRCDSFFYGPRRRAMPPKSCDTCAIDIGTPSPFDPDDADLERSYGSQPKDRIGD